MESGEVRRWVIASAEPAVAAMAEVVVAEVGGGRPIMCATVAELIVYSLEPDVSFAVVAQDLLRDQEGVLAALSGAGVSVVVVSGRASVEAAYRAVSAGARVYLTRAAGVSELREGFEVVVSGRRYVDERLREQVTDLVWERVGQRPAAVLSSRERSVLRLAASGATVAQMSTALGVSQSTVKAHLRSSYAKLGVSSRGAAIAAAVSAEWFRE